ncbi:Hypp4427 [Branchiostoma lanceolatum]|uniref:Hypp4427 protein n=1 Tax=Branchiostoma lanceolatum TaxID=7740 RepID=A0A8K0EY53_BRALA|nr:Hypp4427 [Branchiostoma lanceolatum]
MRRTQLTPGSSVLIRLTASDFREVLFSSDLTASDFPGSSVGVMDDQTPQLRTETNEPTQAASRSCWYDGSVWHKKGFRRSCNTLPYKHGRTCLSDLRALQTRPDLPVRSASLTNTARPACQICQPYKHGQTCLSDLLSLQTRPDLPVRSASLTNTAGPACQICQPYKHGRTCLSDLPTWNRWIGL